ncbi:hypothetical protein J2D73_10220 [Acetobacter sacchari]|uniref:Transposase n=1 Tax=Acetobacter sacchari TaxID=2661687 RepID=A0ABS3LWA5_9PROT|nr:hypothetical protein [Acetobacter sacchari]MBO1360173.1 hypothetical protein [Acetobacter sacchari]
MSERALIIRNDRYWIEQSVSTDMIRRVCRLTRDFAVTAELLGITIREAEAACEGWAKKPAMDGYKVPDRKKAWRRRDLIILGQMWNRGAQADEIAKTLKRSRSSVSGKRRSLGLPARIQVSREQAMAHHCALRKSALESAPDQILTWAQASVLTQQERRGRTWAVRACRYQVTVSSSPNSDKIRWNEAANIECAHRYFALQNHHIIADDFLLTSNSVRSHASLEECIPDSRRKRLAYFVAEDALDYIRTRNIFRRPCNILDDASFWTNSSLRRISRRARNSRKLRGIVDTYDLAA